MQTCNDKIQLITNSTPQHMLLIKFYSTIAVQNEPRIHFVRIARGEIQLVIEECTQ